ncbi:hypothetical protein VY487_004800 [Salmonella enterica]|nr:hypothetical protein [Salmonella enterica]EIF0665354.1 hypothetical protein [Salmonella enterica]EKO0906788.1 hypothetical protein [Salmonella enterica subsp. enterica]EME5787852.1 hypothetical protein [Salmonella enterica]
MRLSEKLPLYAKWVVVWLVVLPMILHRVEYSGAFASAWVCALVVGAGFGLCVPQVDRVFFFLCQRWK